MADNSNATIVDELLVTLGLDASDYEKADKKINVIILNTEKRFQDSDKKEEQRADKRKKRLEAGKKQFKEYGESIGKMAGVIGALLGVGGGAAGFVGMLAALSSTETAMRRATTATGMSVRQLNAWKGTMQSVTGDAEGGANAVGNLAREMKVGRLTGQMPTLAAFASIGVQYKEGEGIDAFLSRAQQTYRNSNGAQQQNIESILAAQGVDANLIQSIKSKRDIGSIYGQKFASSAESDTEGVDSFNSAMADFKNNLRNTATTLMTLVTPAVQAFGQWLNEINPQAAKFAADMKDAGGGVTGFTAAVKERSPQMANALDDIGKGLTFLGQVVDVAAYGLKLLAEGIGKAYDWINDKVGGFLGFKGKDGKGNMLTSLGDWIAGQWKDAVRNARTDGPAPVAGLTGASANPYGAQLTPDAKRRLAALDGHGPAGSPPPLPPGQMNDRVMQFMGQAIASGFTPAQAAALAANANNESAMGTNFGTNMHGLFQWDKSRSSKFRQMFGIDPNAASYDQVLKFITSDPYERSLVQRSFAMGGGANALGTRFSQVFEAHGNTAEDAARGTLAKQYYDKYMQNNPDGSVAGSTAAGPQFNLNGPITVQADNAQEFAFSLRKATNTQAFSSGVR
jgi:hypothetical protein